MKRLKVTQLTFKTGFRFLVNKKSMLFRARFLPIKIWLYLNNFYINCVETFLAIFSIKGYFITLADVAIKS